MQMIFRDIFMGYAYAAAHYELEHLVLISDALFVAPENTIALLSHSHPHKNNRPVMYKAKTI